MGLYSELVAFFQTPSTPGVPPPLAGTMRGQELGGIISAWVGECSIPAAGVPMGQTPMLGEGNPAGLAMIVNSFVLPPSPISPSPSKLMMDAGVNLLCTGVAFTPGTPVMPGMVANTTVGPSMPPTAMFQAPLAPGLPAPALAALWVPLLVATVSSVMVPFVDMAPGTPPVPVPGTVPLMPPPSTTT